MTMNLLQKTKGGLRGGKAVLNRSEGAVVEDGQRIVHRTRGVEVRAEC